MNFIVNMPNKNLIFNNREGQGLNFNTMQITNRTSDFRFLQHIKKHLTAAKQNKVK